MEWMRRLTRFNQKPVPMIDPVIELEEKRPILQKHKRQNGL